MSNPIVIAQFLLLFSDVAELFHRQRGSSLYQGFSLTPVRGQCPSLPILPGAVMGGPAHDEVMKKIPGRQGRPGPHP